MKNILFAIVLGLFFNLNTYAQLENGSIAPDFTTTDINGNTHRLYDYLDQGYTVIMDLSATWCGPCWNYHISGAFEELWKNHGPLGEDGVDPNTTDDVMILWVEGDPSTAVTELENSQLGDWTNPNPSEGEIHFPIINDDNLANTYNISYWPTVYTICPSRVITLTGTASPENHYANLTNCEEAVEGNNAALLTFDGNLAVSECENSASGNVSVSVQNMGSDILTAFTVEVIVNGNSIASEEFSGSLNTYEITQINFGNLTIEAEQYEIKITSDDNNTSDNTINQTLSIAGSTSQQIKVSLLTDSYASETYLEIKDENGNIVWQEGNEAVQDQYGLGNDPVPTDPTTPLTNNTQYDWVVNLPSTGCFRFNIGDHFGDGLFASQWTGGVDGNWSIKNNNDVTIGQLIDMGEFENSDGANFENSTISSINELNNLDLSVYPNPVVSNATIELNLTKKSNVSMNVVDVLGKLVASNSYNLNSGNNKINLDVNNIENGVYFIELNVNGSTSTKKITVTK